MPSLQEKIVQSVPVEKAPDFAELQRQKEELFKEIEKKSLELSGDDKMNIVEWVSGYSIKDGFELSKNLGVDGESYAISGLSIAGVKNRDFVKKLFHFVESNKDYTPDPAGTNIFLNAWQETIEENVKDNIRALSSDDMEKVGRWPFSKEIDTYYSHFIRNRRVRSPELPPNELTKVELTAEDHLRSNEAMLEESYYTGPVRKALGLSDEESLRLAQPVEYPGRFEDLDEEQAWALRSNLIDKKALLGIFYTRNLTATDEDGEVFIESLKNARYAPSKLLFDERKRGAEKGLVEQIKQSLITRGFKEDEFEIKQNDNGEYEVVEKEENESRNETDIVTESIKRKGNFKTDKEIPITVIRNNNKEILSDVKIVEDEIYSVYDDKERTYRIVKKDGDIISHTYSHVGKIENICSVGGKILAFDHGNNKGKRDRWEILEGSVIGSNYDAIKESGVQKIDESYYWVGVDGKDDQKEKNIEAGHYQIIKDNVAESGANGLKTPPKLYTIGGKLCHINEWKSGAVKIYYDDEPVGEIYDDIKLCENSTDKLVFYARKGDDHFVYVDGVENKLPLKSINPYNQAKFSNLVKAGEDYYMHSNSETTVGTRIESIYHFYFDENNGLIEERSNYRG